MDIQEFQLWELEHVEYLVLMVNSPVFLYDRCHLCSYNVEILCLAASRIFGVYRSY